MIFPDLKFDANILYSYNRFSLINTLRKKYDQSTISLATISSFDHLPIIKFNYSLFLLEYNIDFLIKFICGINNLLSILLKFLEAYCLFRCIDNILLDLIIL